MIRLAISVEGQTEEEFINRVLASQFIPSCSAGRGTAAVAVAMSR